MADLQELTIGDYVRVGARRRESVIKFIGSGALASWVGVELDEPVRHDVTVRSQRYFNCRPGHALFVRREHLQPKQKSEQAVELKNPSEVTVQTPCREGAENTQDTEANKARQISVVINHALTGDFVANVSLSSTSTIRTVKEHLAEQEHPRLHGLVLGAEPLDENTGLEELLLVSGEPVLELHMIRMAKRRVQLARARGRSSLGWLLFQGSVPGLTEDSQDCLGLEMDDPFGDCDGTHNGIRYFPCKPNCGLFVKPDDVRFVDDEAELQENDRVRISHPTRNDILGKVCFRGHTSFALGEWVGIELNGAIGKNNGCVNGVRYFWCAANHGIFVRSHVVERWNP